MKKAIIIGAALTLFANVAIAAPYSSSYSARSYSSPSYSRSYSTPSYSRPSTTYSSPRTTYSNPSSSYSRPSYNSKPSYYSRSYSASGHKYGSPSYSRNYNSGGYRYTPTYDSNHFLLWLIVLNQSNNRKETIDCRYPKTQREVTLCNRYD